jgi:hypothetical protein
MRIYIVLLLITGIVWAQADFDTLIMKNGTTYFGEYSKIEEEIVYFKPQGVGAFQRVSVKQIQTLKLKDGHFIIGGPLSTKEIVLSCCVIITVVIILSLYLLDKEDLPEFAYELGPMGPGD